SFAIADDFLRYAKAWMRAPTRRFCQLLVSRALSALARLSPRCLLSCSYAIGCWEYRAVRSSRLPWRQMFSPRSPARLPADLQFRSVRSGQSLLPSPAQTGLALTDV